MRMAVARELDFAPTSQPKARQKPQFTQALRHGRGWERMAIGHRALLLRFVIRSLTEGVWLQFGMIREQVFLEDFDFVVREIGFREVGALLEDDDTKTVCR